MQALVMEGHSARNWVFFCHSVLLAISSLNAASMQVSLPKRRCFPGSEQVLMRSAEVRSGGSQWR